jgi:hypothetical protein
MGRRAQEIRAEIASLKTKIQTLRVELRAEYATQKNEIVVLRKAGLGLHEIAAKLGVPYTIVVNNLHRASVRRPGKRLYDYSPRQQCQYRKARRSGVSAEEARAAAGMD